MRVQRQWPLQRFWSSYGRKLMSSSRSMILNKVNKLWYNFTYSGASGVDYDISNSNCLCNFISNFFIESRQTDSNHYPLCYKICQSVGSRPSICSSQCRVLYSNALKATQYVFNAKHELTSTHGKNVHFIIGMCP